MAIVKPFFGVRYNPERIEDMQAVVSQPYDRINTTLLDTYYQLSPYNIARIIKGQEQNDDLPEAPGGPNVYTRARSAYYEWLKEEVLIREERPAFYAYEQTFSVEGRQYVRLGMIAAIELADYDEGVVLPHEHTHPGPKADRLRLLNTLPVNPEPIFMLYPDPENQVNALIRGAIEQRAPDVDVVEVHESQVRQRMWVIDDPAIIHAIQIKMAAMRNLIIADGHHRYATALTYRNQQRELHPGASPEAGFNFITTALVSMDDPGLVVLPTHREIMHFDAVTPAAILERAREVFDVEPVEDLETALEAVQAHPDGHAFGFYGGPQTGFQVLTLKDRGSLDRLIANEHSPVWKGLPVSVVHDILLDQIAGVPREGIDQRTLIRYHRDPQQPVETIDQGIGNFAIFVSPTKMEDIRVCAAQGERMPQKSTDFYPKIIAGLVLRPVGDSEAIGTR